MTSITLVILVGIASQYSPGLMESVVAVRQRDGSLPLELPQVDGFVAAEDCGRIDEVWLVRPAGARIWGRVMVADCSGHAETTSWMKENNILVELGWPLVEAFGGERGRGLPVEVVMGLPELPEGVR